MPQQFKIASIACQNCFKCDEHPGFIIEISKQDYSYGHQYRVIANCSCGKFYYQSCHRMALYKSEEQSLVIKAWAAIQYKESNGDQVIEEAMAMNEAFDIEKAIGPIKESRGRMAL